MSKKAQEQENLSRYGVSFDLGNPKSLEDRMLRANYWRIENGWKTLVNYVNGKSKKYYALLDQFARAKTESERAVIIEQMEKMFPTKKVL